jgi:hypothetical protein
MVSTETMTSNESISEAVAARSIEQSARFSNQRPDLSVSCEAGPRCSWKKRRAWRESIDISGHRSKSVREFDGQKFDYVITVCDSARESCPVFFGGAERLHHSFDDPAALDGPQEERLNLFRRVRDELRSYLREFSFSE